MPRLIRNPPGWLAPLLLAAWFSLECFAELQPFSRIGEATLPFAASAIGGLILYGAVRMALRDADRASIWTSIFLVTFYSFSYVVKALKDSILKVEVSPRYVLIGMLAIWGFSLALVARRRPWNRKVSQFFVTVAALLALYAGARSLVPTAPAPNWGGEPLRLRAAGEKPDIFYIILDSHTSPESLREHWNYDASWFTSSLRNSGFVVLENSVANCDSTGLCMGSIFNMEAPPKFPESWRPFASIAQIIRGVQRGGAKLALRDAGYELFEFSIFPGLDQKAPFYRHPGSLLGSVHGLALMKTPIGPAMEHVWLRSQGRNCLRVMEEVVRAAKTPSSRPRLIYAHVLLPHAPYFFDRHGNPVLKGVGPHYKDATKEDYLEQLIYTEQLVTNMVAKIQGGAARKPVIILQGDHGFRYLRSDAAQREGLTALNAMYLPGGNTEVRPYPGMTPVNTFPLLFNRYFNARRSYVADFSRTALDLIQGDDPDEVP